MSQWTEDQREVVKACIVNGSLAGQPDDALLDTERIDALWDLLDAMTDDELRKMHDRGNT